MISADRAQVHDADAVGNVLDHGQVMSNEHISKVLFLLQTDQQIHDLGLNGNIQCGDWLVADDKLRLNCQSPGNADALALAAGKLVDIAGSMF